MEKLSALWAHCARNSPLPGEFPAQRPVTRSFDVFFDLHLSKRWINNWNVGDLRRNHAHYDVTVMHCAFWMGYIVIRLASYECHGVSDHREFSCLFKNLSILTYMKKSIKAQQSGPSPYSTEMGIEIAPGVAITPWFHRTIDTLHANICYWWP